MDTYFFEGEIYRQKENVQSKRLTRVEKKPIQCSFFFNNIFFIEAFSSKYNLD